MQVIPHNDPAAEASDAPKVLVNIESGRIAEIPCGPRDSQYMSGDRLVVWSRDQEKAIIPTRHATTWRFYEDFCADPEVAKRHNLSVEDSKRYYAAYLDLMRVRGVGARAKHLHGVSAERVAEVWHPEVRRLKAEHKASRGQSRVADGAFDGVLAKLRKPTEAVKK